jgi:hypothetical protein
MLNFLDFGLLGTYEKATRQQGGLFSRENSSNGGLKNRQNFLAKSYEPKTRVSSKLLINKSFVFSRLNKGCQKGRNGSF